MDRLRFAIELLFIAGIVWVGICIRIHFTLQENFPYYSWHWKFYEGVYKSVPSSHFQYTWGLILAPVGIAVLFFFSLCIAFVAFAVFFIFDWIIKPIVFGEHVVNWKDKNYWLGNALLSRSMRPLRDKPEYKKVFPHVSSICILALGSALVATYFEYRRTLAQMMMAHSPVSFILIGLIVTCIVVYLNKDTIARQWKKCKSKTCHRFRPPYECD